MSDQAISNSVIATQSRACGPVQLNARNKYRAEWIYLTPPGFRDEPFDVSWTFIVSKNGNIQRGFPVQLDDDAPYIIRGFISDMFTTAPGLATLYDCYGNPLQNGLAYLFGGWAFGSYAWPVDQQIECPPGGVITMDFQLPNTGGNATISGCFVGVKRRQEC